MQDAVFEPVNLTIKAAQDMPEVLVHHQDEHHTISWVPTHLESYHDNWIEDADGDGEPDPPIPVELRFMVDIYDAWGNWVRGWSIPEEEWMGVPPPWPTTWEWDGMIEGEGGLEPAPEGVYTYEISAECHCAGSEWESDKSHALTVQVLNFYYCAIEVDQQDPNKGTMTAWVVYKLTNPQGHDPQTCSVTVYGPDAQGNDPVALKGPIALDTSLRTHVSQSFEVPVRLDENGQLLPDDHYCAVLSATEDAQTAKAVNRDWQPRPALQHGRSQELYPLKVDLFVNEDLEGNPTADDLDDIVVKEPPEDARQGALNGTPGSQTFPEDENNLQGPADNHIPLTVRLLGADSAQVSLTPVGGGQIRIEKLDGTPYPPEGEEVTVGTDLELNIFGVGPSSALDDVTIEARTDLTGNAVVGEEDLSVVWIYASDIHFRGSDHEGQALTEGNSAKFSNTDPWMEDRVGRFIYHKPVGEFDAALWQMEIKFQVSPDVVIPAVTWDVKRDASMARWGPGDGELERVVLRGETGWEDDDDQVPQVDEDLQQEEAVPELFSTDHPGVFGLGYPDGELWRAAMKGKFREWMEARIANRWFVCSRYDLWRALMHVKYQDGDAGWVKDDTKTNEIVEGTIQGFAATWGED